MTQVGSARAASYVLNPGRDRPSCGRGGKPAETLMNVVALIAERFETDVCSAYLLEPDRANLVLAATLACGRNASARCEWRCTEGLAGLVAEQVRPVAVEQVKAHPRFKYFSEAGEEPTSPFWEFR